MGSRDRRRHQHSPGALLAQARLPALHQRAVEVSAGLVVPACEGSREELRVPEGTGEDDEWGTTLSRTLLPRLF